MGKDMLLNGVVLDTITGWTQSSATINNFRKISVVQKRKIWQDCVMFMSIAILIFLKILAQCLYHKPFWP